MCSISPASNLLFFLIDAVWINYPFKYGFCRYLLSNTLDMISKAVFEVVVSKPIKDSLSYERPLPMKLLPFSIRTDKYYSIGTAFAVSPT